MKFLGRDELEAISKKLTFSPDYTRFRSVCKSWRLAAPKRPQLPWLIARDMTVSDERKSIYRFYRFTFETNKLLPIPELSELSLYSLLPSSPFSFVENKVDCIGYSHGWMALFNRSNESVSLFNPLTNYSIDLPTVKKPRACAFNWKVHSSHFSFYLTSDPGASLSDCFALVYTRDSKNILYCKVGCTDWMEMPNPGFYKCSYSIHVCCYRGKTFIASNGDVFVCDFGLSGCNPIVEKIVSFSQYDTQFDLISDSCLVESDGDLLLVLRRFFDGSDEDDESNSFNYFQAFKLEFGWHMAKLVVLKSLGDKALFCSPWATFSLTASKYAGCKDNSIYAIYDDVIVDYGITTHKLKTFGFKEGSSMIVNDDDDDDTPLYVGWEHCGWFTPSLLK